MADTETRMVDRDPGERAAAVLGSIFFFGAAGWASQEPREVWIKDTKQVVVDVPTIEKVDVQYTKRSVFRMTYEREHHEVWKVLAGGVKVFKEFAQSDWKKIKEELVDVTKQGRANEPEMPQ